MIVLFCVYTVHDVGGDLCAKIIQGSRRIRIAEINNHSMLAFGEIALSEPITHSSYFARSGQICAKGLKKRSVLNSIHSKANNFI